MFGKSYRILAVSVLLLSLSLLWARPVSRGAVPLWYEFHVGQDAGEAASHVAVTLPNHTGCAGAFQVFADGSWGFWDTPSEEDWIGTGSDAGYGMTMWASDLVPGTYYVRMGTGANPACGLGVSGVAVDRVEVIDLVPGVRGNRDDFGRSSTRERCHPVDQCSYAGCGCGLSVGRSG